MKIKSTQRDLVLKNLNNQALLRLKELTDQGVTPSTISRMVDNGDIMRVARGIYQASDNNLGKLQRFAEVAKLVPNGIICLTSALFLHGVLNENPENIWVAVEKNSWVPKHEHRAIKIVRFSNKYYSECVEIKDIKGIPIRTFSIGKSVVDCFRFRNKIGFDTARKSLEQTLIKDFGAQNEIFDLAQKSRVFKIVYPYLVMYCANSSIG